LIFLLEYIIDYESDLINNLEYPIILNNNSNLYLGNNAVEQLNIITKDGTTTLLDLLNNCSTAFGKRFFKERLLNPINNKKELNRRYNLSEKFKDNISTMKNSLNNIYDLEKIKRKIEINKIQPFELSQLYFSLTTILKMDDLIPENIKLSEIKDIVNKIEDTFIISDCGRFNIDTINQNLLKPKINNELDISVNIINNIQKDYENFVEIISSFYKTKDFLVLQYTEKDGFFFTMTKTRYKLLEKDMDERFFKFQNKNIFMNEFTYTKRTTQVKITHSFMKELNDKYILNLNKIINFNKDFFQKISYSY